MKFENTDVWGFEHAIRGARNPMNSWDRSDSGWIDYHNDYYKIGENDLQLLQKLIKAGSEHRKFMRQIFVSVDITAPMFWFSEFDTYKIGTVANSTSKIHKLASTPITIDCFETDDYNGGLLVYDKEPYNENFIVDDIWEKIINHCETLRERYLETKNIAYWKELIRLLPESWLQTRTITMNYENVLTICRQRQGHKLTEWKQFIDWAHTLPYAEELIFVEDIMNGTESKEA